MQQFGHTRTSIHRNHAFIAPDGHVQAPLPGWTKTQGTILISPHLGAGFTMYIATMEAAATAGHALPVVQRFLYVLEGRLTLEDTSKKYTLQKGWYAYFPVEAAHTLTAETPSKLVIFEKPYIPHEDIDPPDLLVGNAADQPSAAFMGDEDAQLKPLLPDDLPFDMAVNLFTFQPGTPLPFVETHIMEHGMIMLEGGGIYRLDDQWYPIQEGDVLWMGPYCPQWFGALGKPQSTYLYYKNMNRDALIL